jgi:DNA polymerase-3 subunit beta
MSITAHNPEHDEAEEEVSIDYKGHPYSISFNAQYLIDAVTHIDSDHIILVLTKNLSSCFINDPNNSNFQFIVMPMRL